MPTTADLELARAAFDRRAWSDVIRHLEAVEAAGELDPIDFEPLGVARQMLGRPDVAVRDWERGHKAALAKGDSTLASRLALLIAITCFERGDIAQATGWHARAGQLLEAGGGDSIERGFFLIPLGLGALMEGDGPRALGVFEEIAAIAERLGDREGIAMACLGRGQALMAMGEIERGTAFLDQAMVAATLGEVSPINVGRVYCASIEAFGEVFDLRRAQEWTGVLHEWCESQPEAVPFRGRCLVFRSELLQLHGSWDAAAHEIERARAWLLRPPPEPAAGEALYQTAELHRVRGEVREAEAAYREGASWGRRPEPGMALLRLARGDVGGAASAIRQALAEAGRVGRTRMLEPFVEIMLAAGDVPAARGAMDELTELAARLRPAPLLEAVAARAEGRVRLAQGDAAGALAALRRSWDAWRPLDAPYEIARVRVAIGEACRAIGDDDAALAELTEARAVFEGLGAVPDRQRVDALLGAAHLPPAGLSAREVEVLAHLARGLTNRQIGESLGISERTVDRHVSNVYTKLDVSSRAAATAFAIAHDLL